MVKQTQGLRDYYNSTHRMGRLWTLAALILILLVPFLFCLIYGVDLNWKAFGQGALAILPMYYAVGIIEVFNYAPLLGSGEMCIRDSPLIGTGRNPPIQVIEHPAVFGIFASLILVTPETDIAGISVVEEGFGNDIVHIFVYIHLARHIVIGFLVGKIVILNVFAQLLIIVVRTGADGAVALDKVNFAFFGAGIVADDIILVELFAEIIKPPVFSIDIDLSLIHILKIRTTPWQPSRAATSKK